MNKTQEKLVAEELMLPLMEAFYTIQEAIIQENQLFPKNWWLRCRVSLV